MSDAAERSADTCYRHPDRPSWVLCQRCGRTICPDCQTQAAVGVQCPECVKEGRASTPRVRRASGWMRAFRPGTSNPVVTWSIAGLTAVVYIAQVVVGLIGPDYVTGYLQYVPAFTPALPWTMLTYALVHANLIHLVFNLYALLIVGPILEAMLGRVRFLALYVLSTLGGAVAVLWLAPNSIVVGASGAVFGCFAALVILQRGLGRNPTGLIIVIALNLVIGFLPGFNISWQAHVGGLAVGAAVAAVYVATRRQPSPARQIGLLALVTAALIGATVLRFALA